MFKKTVYFAKLKVSMLPESEAASRLTEGRFQFPPLDLTGVEREPSRMKAGRPDWLLEFRWQNRRERFAVEYKSLATPKRLTEALAQARRYRAENITPMLMTSYLDESWLDRLAAEEVSGLDFSGNGVVTVPGQWLVYRTGRPNAFPASQYIQDIYRGRSSLVPRVLLVQRQFDQVTQVRDEIQRRGGQISLSTVSKVLSRLEEEVLISREDGVELLQPGQLLDRLVNNYRPPTVDRRRQGRVSDLEFALQNILAAAEREGFDVVGRGDRVYTAFPGSEASTTLYTSNLDAILSQVEIEETRRFSDIEVLETDDETVFFDPRRSEDFLWTSPLETYLLLTAGGKREQEVGEQVRTRVLSEEEFSDA